MKKLIVLTTALLLTASCAGLQNKKPQADEIAHVMASEFRKELPQHLASQKASVASEMEIYRKIGCLSDKNAKAMGQSMGLLFDSAGDLMQETKFEAALSQGLQDRFSSSEVDRLHAVMVRKEKNEKPNLESAKEDLALLSRFTGVAMEAYMGEMMQGFTDPEKLDGMMKKFDRDPAFKSFVDTMAEKEVRELKECVVQKSAELKTAPIKEKEKQRTQELLTKGLY